MYREGRKRSAWGWNAKCPHGGETRTFVSLEAFTK